MPAFGRLQQATAIVPLALLSAAWTVSLAGVGMGSASAEGDGSGALPDGTALPTKAIEAPANIIQDGSLPPGLSDDRAADAVSAASTSGIPQTALAAYQLAEAVINDADRSCRVPWQLIAAIGRVESDHGRFGGNTLDSRGVARPGIYGIALNGKNNTVSISDTDGGQYDDDTRWDRAVGPMQFIPSTWSVVGVDGDSDGQRNPQDVDDASLATAVYLCSGDDDLSTEQGQRASVYRYNHSNDYVDLVLAFMQAYLDGDFSSVPTSAGLLLPESPEPTKRPKDGGRDRDSNGDRDRGTQTPTPQPSKTPRPTKTPTPTTTPTQTPSETASQSPTPKVTETPTVIPTQLPTVLPSSEIPTVPQPLTYAEALAQCRAAGYSELDLAALNGCIDKLMNP